MSGIINNVIISIVLFCWIVIAIIFIIGRLSPVKTTKAEVFDKYIRVRASAYPKVLRGDNYIIVFSCDGRKLSF